ncbi:MAG: Dihydroneopterin aldolase [Candidatus Tokpelaia sp. JSC085]|nr:MAG: Dihydroneopterin aldolase [Candidatus Tokpelaia sp. JSC085]
MTKVLLKICNGKEAVIRARGDADILDIAVKNRQTLSDIAEIMQILDGKVQLSLTVSLPFVLSCSDHPSFASVDILRIKGNRDGYKKKWEKLEQFIHRHKTILLTNTEYNQHLWLQQVKAAGFYGIMLENYSGNLLCAEKFVHDVKCHGLIVGLAGELDVPDVPRLLPCNPDILGFSLAQMGKLSHHNPELIRSFIPSVQAIMNEEVIIDSRTDRILVSDFILSMCIGAYHHEKNAQQRVRFNVAVDVIRVSKTDDIRYIFSYDLILDLIRRLASHGHITLVETLAERIAQFILGYKQVRCVMVRVEKLDLGPGSIGVEIIRKKETVQASKKR